MPTRYFMLNTVGEVKNEDYCFTDNAPKGVMDAYDLSVGTRVADEYPGGIGEVTLQLGEDYPGVQPTSFLGNTDSLLIVDRKAAAIIQAHEVGEVEVIPFKLLNHKGRVHSQDYVFLNLVGSVDCLDANRTQRVLHKDGSLMKITRFVLASAKLRGAPDLFRVKEDLVRYVFSEKLVNDLRKQGCTNFVFEELEVS